MGKTMKFLTKSTAGIVGALMLMSAMPASAQNANEDAVNEYRSVLQQISNLKTFGEQQNLYVKTQKEQIDNLRGQLRSVGQVKQGIMPMMLKMIGAIEDSIRSDLPFNLDERLARVNDVQSVLVNPGASPAEQYRQVLGVFEDEVEYGQEIDSYEGAHPTSPGNTVDFIRFGRVALVYMSKDESELALYNMSTRDWDQIGGSQALQMRQAIRIAKGEAAPGIVTAPVILGQ